jgi:phosphate transport system substrate-binding protein
MLNKITYGYVVNKAGNTIKPSFEATSEAANIELPEDTRIIFTDTPAKTGYPIAGFTWMLVHENLEKNKAIKTKSEAEELIKFLVWSITDGQKLSEKLGYSKLPKAAVDRNKEMIRQLKWNGEEIGKKILG